MNESGEPLSPKLFTLLQNFRGAPCILFFPKHMQMLSFIVTIYTSFLFTESEMKRNERKQQIVDRQIEVCPSYDE